VCLSTREDAKIYASSWPSTSRLLKLNHIQTHSRCVVRSLLYVDRAVGSALRAFSVCADIHVYLYLCPITC
jgi:hypothetical protein